MRSLETSPPRAGKWGYIIAASIWLVDLERPACYFSPCKVFSFYWKREERGAEARQYRVCASPIR